MTPFLANLVLFSPLLAIAALILYILDRADHLRRGSGLIPELERVPLPGEEEEEGEGEEEVEEEYDEEYDDEGPPELVDPSPELVDPSPDDVPGPGDEGVPTNPPMPIPMPTPVAAPRTRTVGTKKARSLASRDQRRAYHEFQLSQQEARTRAAAATAADHDERVFAEKRRRALVEEEIDERVRAARAARAAEERAAEERHRRDVQCLKGIVMGGGGEGEGEGGAWELGALAAGVGGGRSGEWVAGVLRAEGMVGVKGGGVCAVVTEAGWYVRVGPREMAVLYRELEGRGRMEWGEMARVLEGTLKL
ncbi:hypothetical protein DFP73DRAFT_522521 [Morchella snyderi]|nr:hypothetical protein DFP73DRAFT_522521 [Morchella snyderi]